MTFKKFFHFFPRFSIISTLLYFSFSVFINLKLRLKIFLVLSDGGSEVYTLSLHMQWEKEWEIMANSPSDFKGAKPFLLESLLWPLAVQGEHIHSIDREGRFSLRGWTGDCTLFILWEFFGLVLKRVLSFILLFLQCGTFMNCPLYVRYCAMSYSLVYKEIVFLRGKPALKAYKFSHSLASMWDCFQDLSRYQICRWSSPWYKTTYYLNTTMHILPHILQIICRLLNIPHAM